MGWVALSSEYARLVGSSGPPASGYWQRLLPTIRSDVPDVYVDGLATFCAEAREIERGYVCAVRVERDGAEPEQRLMFCVKLRSPVSAPEDSREVRRRLFALLSRSRPEIARTLGLGVMADRAVDLWERTALRVYNS